MKPTTIAAIYFQFWFLSLFLVLPFGVRTAEEEGVALVPGQAESAPANFSAWRTIKRTSILAAILIGNLLSQLPLRLGDDRGSDRAVQAGPRMR